MEVARLVDDTCLVMNSDATDGDASCAVHPRLQE